jgi:hypothetical protein
MDQIFELTLSIKRPLVVFIVGLILSGLTALPLEWELAIANETIQQRMGDHSLNYWIDRVYTGIHETHERYPFISYGTDWLAFAHIMIAVAFIGPWRDPIKNIWVIEFGLVSCICIFPFAFIAGAVREIPLYWRVVDCCFGFVGGILLWRCYRKIKKLEKLKGV